MNNNYFYVVQKGEVTTLLKIKRINGKNWKNQITIISTFQKGGEGHNVGRTE